MWRVYKMARASVLEINSGNYGGLPQGFRKLPDANVTLTSSDSGKAIIVIDNSADRTITLPAEEVGLNFKFWFAGTAADGHDMIIDSGSDTNYFVGGVVHLDSDASGDNIATVYSDADSNSKLQINLPETGTMVELICDGTLWYVNGQVVSTTAPTFADQ